MRATLATLLISPAYQKLRYRSAWALYLMILVLGSVPGARSDIGHYASGIVLHSVAYAGLTFLLFSGSSGTPLRRALQSVLTIMLMGALDEFIQSQFPYRNGTIGDWLVDCNAAVIAAVLLGMFWPKAERAWQS